MKKITLPLTDEEISSLKCGDKVLLSGTIFSARDQAHKRIFNLVQDGKPLPFDLKNASIYYAGPCPAPEEKVSNSFGPTTSTRMDPFTPTLLDLGLKIMIGKGKRSDEIIKSIAKNKCLYFSAIGGAGAIYGNAVKSMEIIAFPELLSEAIRKVEIVDFPVILYIDSQGNSL